MSTSFAIFSPISYQEGFQYPQEFIDEVLIWWPEKENEGPISKIFHQALFKSDITVGRALSDAVTKESPNPRAVELYNWWCQINKDAPKRPREDEGLGEGWSVKTSPSKEC